MYGHHILHAYRKSLDQPGRVANPARGQLSRENEQQVVLPGNLTIIHFCLVGKKPDKELPGIEGARRDRRQRVLISCMMCVVIFVLPLSQLQGVEWGWPGRREPDDEHSPAS